jgi:hypothetical protein
MSDEEKVDELVDKAIDEALAKFGRNIDDIKDRKPKPFRYITDQEEIKAELSSLEKSSVSVMKDPSSTQIFEENIAVLGLGNVEVIENVVKRHEASKKFIEK